MKTPTAGSTTAGLPPGTLVHVGERKIDEVRITIFDYDQDHVHEEHAPDIDACLQYRDTPSTTWVNIDGIHDATVIERLGEHFGLHPLLQEDILNTEQRPKIEDYGEYLFIVAKMLTPLESGTGVEMEHLSLVIGGNFVFTFQEDIGDVFDGIRDHLRNGTGRIRKLGPDYLAYLLIDAVVDGYYVALERIGEKIDSIEERVIENPTPAASHDIHTLKREMVYLRRAIWPLREIVATLERGQSPLIDEATTVYLRDIYDHTIQIIDTVETFRDILSGMLDIYLSSLTNRLNEVMKVLTIIATIFIPLTFITGVYGMNFRFMPELEWRYGYPIVILGCVLIAGGMIVYFHRRKWL